MSLLTTRIRLIRETNKMYNDHADSVATFLDTTGHPHETEGAMHEIEAFRAVAVEEIIEATTLDNTV